MPPQKAQPHHRHSFIILSFFLFHAFIHQSWAFSMGLGLVEIQADASGSSPLSPPFSASSSMFSLTRSTPSLGPWHLLERDGFRGKKDTSTALYSLCSIKENKIRAVQSGIMKPLVELMADFGWNMVDKSVYMMSVLVSVSEAYAALVEEDRIPMLVEIMVAGSQRQNEISVAILLQNCENSGVYSNMVASKGAFPSFNICLSPAPIVPSKRC
ncbi:hypothetical protein ACFX2I_006402 [Malus domestica]